MAKRILVPVFPSDTFYDAVVAARDIVAYEGGVITFLFTQTRPPEAVYAEAGSDGHPSKVDISDETINDDEDRVGDGRDYESWRERQINALDQARDLLAERDVGEDRIGYTFADSAAWESSAQAIADEAAAGAYDLVVLSRGYFVGEVDDCFSSPEEVAGAIQSLAGEVKLLVT